MYLSEQTCEKDGLTKLSSTAVRIAGATIYSHRARMSPPQRAAARNTSAGDIPHTWAQQGQTHTGAQQGQTHTGAKGEQTAAGTPLAAASHYPNNLRCLLTVTPERPGWHLFFRIEYLDITDHGPEPEKICNDALYIFDGPSLNPEQSPPFVCRFVISSFLIPLSDNCLLLSLLTNVPRFHNGGSEPGVTLPRG